MRILCIDGGGIRGILAIAMLKELEQEYNTLVGDLFDVIAGTSTGSIIASSIALKKKMSDVHDNYLIYGEKIFERQAQLGLFKSVYSDRFLRRYFQKAFGDIELADIKKPLLIPAVDVTHGKPFVHRSNFSHDDNPHSTIKLWDAVLSSCSAPLYFPPNNINNEYLSIDGGLWANNPSLVCITEALQFFKKTLKEIHILSIGTGLQNINFTGNNERYWGVKQWLPFHFPSMKVKPKLLDLALNLSSESISYQCHVLLGDNYLRVNKELGREISFDEIDTMKELSILGKEMYDKKSVEIKQFLDG